MKETCVITIIETLQDYLRYKESCKRRDREIKEFRQNNQNWLVKEDACFEYGEQRIKQNSIPIIDIIEYLEDFEPEMIDDLKAIQLMLYKIAGWRCNEEEYRRIGKADKKVMRKAKRERRNIIVKNGQYNENVNKMQNNYGRRKDN